MNKNELFEQYFLMYKDLTMRFVMWKGGDYEVAQEICQQTFCSFYVHMDGIEDSLVKAWLFRTAQNALIDHFRKNEHKKEISLDTSSGENGSVMAEISQECCEEQVIQSEMTGRILKEVRETNLSYYEVLNLICVEGLSYKEAAKRLHVSVQVVRTRLHRAREYVRMHYGEEYWGDF